MRIRRVLGGTLAGVIGACALSVALRAGDTAVADAAMSGPRPWDDRRDARYSVPAPPMEWPIR